MTDADFRGTGWRFPVAPDDGGGLGYVSLDDNVGQSVELLLNTVAGERTMRLEFGTTAPRLLFEADSEQNLFQLEQAVGDALRRWEPRVEVERVAAASDPAHDGHVVVTVRYRVLRTNTRRNLVFPFYLLAGTEAVEQ
jgi:phage baseplate assembly protein W